MKAGHAIVALKEDSFRSNGLSLARKIMEKHFGKNWHEEDRKLAEQILSPSKLYTRFAVSLFGGVDGQPAAHVSAMAHVTGGGIPGKLGRALKPSGGLGAELSDLFEPCNAMKTLIEMGGVAESEAYKAWNMGNGFLVVTDEPDAVLKQAKKFKLEAKTVGHVTKTPAVHINGKE